MTLTRRRGSHRRRGRGASLAAMVALALPGCGAGAGGGAGTGVGSGLEGTVTVLAAASLTEAFGEIGTAFEVAHPGVTLALHFGPSSSLREQVLAAAPADVFAPADTSNMDAVVAVGAAADPEEFATNQLQIVVPAHNPAGITGLADFAGARHLLGLCAEQAPCGQLARQALTRAAITPSVDTEEPDVRALLTKVGAGELDAGIVYRTDVLAAGETVEGVDLPADVNVTATYPIAVLSGGENPEGAEAFVALVRSEVGRAVLRSHGFGAP